MDKKIFLLCLLSFLFSSICFSQEQADYPKYILYLPQNVEATHKYPLVAALSPSADAQSMINTWKPVADKYKWIILASKEFKNGANIIQSLVSLDDTIQQVCKDFPIDKSKIIVTGFSGGGMGAHGFSYEYPSIVSVIIINTGIIHEYYLSKQSTYPHNKIAVFLASPTDFRYKEMQHDRDLLKRFDWTVKWIEFQGGHMLAPQETYLEAAKWIIEEWQILEKSKDVNAALEEKSDTTFRLDGIIFNPQGKSSVIINGEILQEGERLKGLFVTKINKDSVEVMINGDIKTLKLD